MVTSDVAPTVETTSITRATGCSQLALATAWPAVAAKDMAKGMTKRMAA